MDVTKIISWLPFNESTTQDLLGNTWTAYGTTSISDVNAINENALQLNKGYLRSDGQITFGGADFTISLRAYLASNSHTWGGLFCAQPTTNTGNSNNAGCISFFRSSNSNNLALQLVNASNTTVADNAVVASNFLNGLHHFELDYSHADSMLKIFIDGQLTYTKTVAIERLARYIYLGCTGYDPDGQRMSGTIDEFLLFDGVALHTENFTPPTANDYTDWQLAVAGYAPAKISFDVETYLRNAQKGWRVYNPGEAELLATEGATTVEVPYTQSVTGKAFYGGTLSDMFHTPAGLKEIWIRFDFVAKNYSDSYLRVGHWNSSQNSIVGLGGGALAYSQYNRITFNGATILNPVFNQRYKCLLHIKSDATNGLVELTIDKDFYSYSGNVNGGNDLNNLVVLNTSSSVQFSNVVVSETELTLDDGWHRDSFGVETKINAPVLNVRLQGENKKFPLSTKRKSNSLTIRVGDRNFYNTSVATSSSLAGAARYLLDDKARALSTSAT